MELLLHKQLAPLTTHIAFFNNPSVEEVATALHTFHSEKGIFPRHTTNVVKKQISGNLSEVLQQLLPLTNVEIRRHLVIAAEDGRVAYFNNYWRGDLGSVYAYLPPMIKSQAVKIRVEPRTLIKDSPNRSRGRYGICELGIYGTVDTRRFGNQIRVIHVIGDDDGFQFFAAGKPQPFEDLESYHRDRPEERFTFELLKQYCTALGL